MIAMSVCVKVLFEAQNYRCSLSDMILSARDRCVDPMFALKFCLKRRINVLLT